MNHDPVNYPKHYVSHPSGIEAIQITEHMSFCLGNAVKYIWRADMKNGIEDLEKAAWYIARELEKRKKASKKTADELTRHTQAQGLYNIYPQYPNPNPSGSKL